MSAERTIPVTVAEGDQFTLICRVRYRSNVNSPAVWSPTLTWYDYNNAVQTSTTTITNRLQSDVTLTAAVDMHDKRFRCQTSYDNPPSGAIKDDSAVHKYSRDHPTFTDHNYITVTVDCKLDILLFPS